MIYARRVDAPQAEIVRALRAVGASVHSLTGVKGGCPDLLVGWGGRNYLLEVKSQSGDYTPEQREWRATWRGCCRTVHDVHEALVVLGITETM